MELVRKCVAENRKEVPSLLILGEPSPSIALDTYCWRFKILLCFLEAFIGNNDINLQNEDVYKHPGLEFWT